MRPREDIAPERDFLRTAWRPLNEAVKLLEISSPCPERAFKHCCGYSGDLSCRDLSRVVCSPASGDSVENDSFQSKSCADQLKALSEPLRLRIIDILRHGEMTVGDIAEFLETEVVTVSHHLKILKYAGLVEVQREGRFMIYKLRADLLQKAGSGSQYLNLGCCRIEVPGKKTK